MTVSMVSVNSTGNWRDIALGVMHVTLETWLAQWNAHLVDQVAYYTDPHLPPNHLYLAGFN
ncbi:MAG: hypothetical protein ABSH48_08015 [Verrucomicrobiota bacterium]|jgi:hypothetical protein